LFFENVICNVNVKKNKNLAITNRSCASAAHTIHVRWEHL